MMSDGEALSTRNRVRVLVAVKRERGVVHVRAVAQHREAEGVAQIAVQVVLDVARGVGGQALQDDRDVVDAVLARQRGGGVRVVLHDDQTGQTVHDLLGRGAEGVRVVPERLGLVEDLEGGRPGLPGGEGVLRAAVHVGRDVRAVEVDAGVGVEVVGDVQQDRGAGGPLHGGAEVRPVVAGGVLVTPLRTSLVPVRAVRVNVVVPSEVVPSRRSGMFSEAVLGRRARLVALRVGQQREGRTGHRDRRQPGPRPFRRGTCAGACPCPCGVRPWGDCRAGAGSMLCVMSRDA